MTAADAAAGPAGWPAAAARPRPTARRRPRAAAGDLGAAPTELLLLDAVVSGMPDPVVVLDQDGRVIAFNAEAAALAPALRRGEPASIALRMPELVEAIRAAVATGKAQRIEFSVAAAVAALVGGVRCAGRAAGGQPARRCRRHHRA